MTTRQADPLSAPATAKETVVADLLAEGDELYTLLSELADSDWARQTPSTGWTIAHQVAHLAQTDTASILATAIGGGLRSMVTSLDRRQLIALAGIIRPTAAFGI